MIEYALSCCMYVIAAIPEDPSAPEETLVFDGLVIASGTNNWACLPQFDGTSFLFIYNDTSEVEAGLCEKEAD